MQELLERLKTDRRTQIIAGVAVLLLLGIILLIAFGGKKPAAVVVVAPVPVSLIWQVPIGTSGYYGGIISQFQLLPGNGAVSITMVEKDLENNYYKNLITDFAKQQGPDIIAFDGQDLGALREWLTPITGIPGITDFQMMDNYKNDINGFTDLVVKDTTYQNKIWAVTTYVDTMQLYYNKTLLEQASIALPPETWADLDKQLSVLNKKNVDKTFSQSAIALGTGFVTSGKDVKKDGNVANFQDIIPMLIFQAGGQLGGSAGSASPTTNGFDNKFQADDPIHSALRFYLSFSDQQSSRYSWNPTSQNNVDAFLQGKLAFILNYRGFQAEINSRQSRVRYGISEMLQLNANNKKNFGKFISHGITSKLEMDLGLYPGDATKVAKLQKAREFLYYMTSKEAQQSFFVASGLPAARRDLIQAQQSGDLVNKIFANGSLYADDYYRPSKTLNTKMWGDLIYNIRFQNQSLDQSLGSVLNEYNATAQQGSVLEY